MSPQASNSERFHGNPANAPDPLPIAISSGKITERDAEIIRLYVYEHATSSNAGKVTNLQLTRALITFRRWSGPYSGSTIIDLYKIVDGVKTDNSKKGIPYSEQMQRSYISRAKAFFLWLVETGESSIPEKKIRSIKVPSPFSGIKSAADLLTPEEVAEILQACKTSRLRALFTMLYEGGFRVGEVGTLKWGDLKFESAGIVVNVVYKTKKPRYIRLVMCKEALLKWKSDYPGDPSGDAFVFLNSRDQELQYHTVKKMLQRLVSETTITKKVNLHLFRHSRVTHLMQEGVSESVIKIMMWGSVNTRSFATYAHLSGADVDRAIYDLYNIDPSVAEKKQKRLEPKVCPHCKEICGPITRFCPMCGQLLDGNDIKTDEQLQKWLIDNSSFLTAYLNKMQVQREMESALPES